MNGEVVVTVICKLSVDYLNDYLLSIANQNFEDLIYFYLLSK